jgi:uncharacterized phage protein gp47/JayE
VADFPTFTDLFRIARNEALARNGRLSRAVIDREGTDANIIIAGAAAAADEVIGQLIDQVEGLYLDSAKGTKLDRLVFDRYGLARKVASNAVGSVQLTLLAANPAAFVIPIGTQIASSDGIVFLTTAVELFPLGALGPITVAVRSALAGASQQARANTLTSLRSAIPGSPAGLLVNNPLATAGAADAEDDDSLRARARAFWTTARRGTLLAIEQGARNVGGIVSAKAFEVLDALGRPARFVILMVTDSYTDTLATLGTIPPAYAMQSQVLAALVFDGLSDVRAAGIYVQVQVAQTILQPILLNLAFVAGVDVNAVATAARAAAVNYVNGLQPGVTLDVAQLRAAVRAVPGLITAGTDIASPTGNVVPTPLQAIRTTLALVTASLAGSSIPLMATTNPDSFIAAGG